jgi:hypothetical protein
LSVRNNKKSLAIVSQPNIAEDDDSGTDCPFDDDEPWDSTSEEESIGTGAGSSDDQDDNADADNNEVTSTELASPDGLCFTTLDYVETKLLKLKDDAHAPHF